MGRKPIVSDEEIIAARGIGLTATQIATIHKVSRPAIVKRLKRMGLLEKQIEERRQQGKPNPLPPPPTNGLSPVVNIIEPRPLPSVAEINQIMPDASLLGQMIMLRGAISNATAEVLNSDNEFTTVEARNKITAYKDAATALKTLTTIAESTMSIHNGWAEITTESAKNMADRLVKRARPFPNGDQFAKLVAEEFEQLRTTLVKHYNETSPSNMR